MINMLLQHPAEPARIQEALTTFYHLQGKPMLEPWLVEKNYHTAPFTGDVTLLLSVDEDVADERALAQFLARFLPTKVIISDDSLNPYTWVLVDEEGEEHAIYQEPKEELEGCFIVDSRYKYLL
jgi:hypothetical protein